MSPLLSDAASDSVVSDLSRAGFGVGTGVGISGGIGGGGRDDGFFEAVGGNGVGNAAPKAAVSDLSQVRHPDVLLLCYVRFLKVRNTCFVLVILFFSAVNTGCCVRVQFQCSTTHLAFAVMVCRR